MSEEVRDSLEVRESDEPEKTAGDRESARGEPETDRKRVKETFMKEEDHVVGHYAPKKATRETIPRESEEADKLGLHPRDAEGTRSVETNFEPAKERAIRKEPDGEYRFGEGEEVRDPSASGQLEPDQVRDDVVVAKEREADQKRVKDANTKQEEHRNNHNILDEDAKSKDSWNSFYTLGEDEGERETHVADRKNHRPVDTEDTRLDPDGEYDDEDEGRETNLNARKEITCPDERDGADQQGLYPGGAEEHKEEVCIETAVVKDPRGDDDGKEPREEVHGRTHRAHSRQRELNPPAGLIEEQLDQDWDIPISDGKHDHWRSVRVLYHLRDIMFLDWVHEPREEQKRVERALLMSLEQRGYRFFLLDSATRQYHLVPRDDGDRGRPRRGMVHLVFKMLQAKRSGFEMDLREPMQDLLSHVAHADIETGPTKLDLDFSKVETTATFKETLGEIEEGLSNYQRSKQRRRSSVDDPFDIREGKTLIWKSVNMTVVSKGSEAGKQILQDVWGEVPKNETTAIMGPSGSGKTSLLNILSGRVASSAKLSVSADMRLNNYAVDPSNIQIRKQIAFVAQDDSLHVSSTVRESIKFSAKLRLPRSMTDEQLDNITNRMLEELGLLECADTMVGGDLLKGISGGERKRTSVGVELVTKPVMVFLDEPTSGLDSFSALQLCNVLKDVANAGASVMFTIHQPASEIFESFDHLILLNKGRIMYGGSVDTVPDFFGARGQPLPPKYNPADWIMIVAQTLQEEQLEMDGFFPEDDRDLPARGSLPYYSEFQNSPSSGKKDSKKSLHSNMFTQIVWMTRREMRSLRRDKRILGARLMLSGFTSTLMGILFWKVGESDSADRTNLNSHFGASAIVLMTAMFGTALPSLVVFPQERPVFLREYSTNHYSALSYFLSRLSTETILTAIQMSVLTTVSHFMIGFQMAYYWQWVLIFAIAMASTAIAVLLGSSVDDSKLAMELLPLCYVPQFLFSGFFVAPGLIPAWIRWVQWTFPLSYSVRLFLLKEFETCGPDVSMAQFNCDVLLDVMQVDSGDFWWLWLGLLGLFLLFRGTAFFILERKANKFY